MKIRTGEIINADKDKKVVSSVKLSKGTRVGTLKLTVNGDEQDNVLVRGLGGGSSAVIGGSVDTQALWDAINKKVDIDFFKNLFTVYDSSDLEITTNTYNQIPDNLRISVGTWTDEYLSALGKNSDSGGGGGGTGTVTGIAVGMGSDPIYPDYATGVVTIPAYPTRVSQLVNDSNYITASYINNSFYTKAEADSKFMTIAAFENLFNVFSSDGTRLHHPYSSGVNNIKALVGLWTEQYLSALGLNSSGGGGGGGGGSVDVIKVDGVSYTSDQNGVADITNAFTNYAYISGNTIHIGGTTYSYSYNLPTASQSTLGGVKVGNSLTISDGVLNIPTQQGIVSGSSYTKVTVDAYGRITAGENPTTLAGYGITDAYTKTQVDDQFLSKAFFRKLFQAHNGDANVNPVNPTTDASASVDNIEAMFGFWTEQYISALGNNSQSGTAGSVTSIKVAPNTYVDPVEGIIDLSNYVTTSAQRTSWDNKLTNVLYSSKRLQKTINGTTTDIVTASTLFNDGLPTNTPRNYVLASPTDTAGTPEFRALDEADIPDISISKVTSLQTTLNSKANSSVVITAGNGLTGGGSLTGNITINAVSANAAITVNTDSIKLNVINDYTTTANNTIIPLAAARGKDLNDRLAILESWFEEDANGDIKTKNRPNGGSPRGFYTESFVSALGANSQGGGSSSFDEEQMWIALDATDEVIDTSHIPDLASTYGYLKASDLSGYINNISVAGTGNAITAASKSGSTITFTKGNTFLTGVTLTGDVTGSGTTSIATTISNGAVTNAMLAGSIANNKLANSAITINNTSVSLGGTFSTASITAGTIGQSTASSGYTIAVPYVAVNSYGIVTGYGTHTHTVNSIPNSSLVNSSVTVNGTSVSLGDSVTTTKWGTSRNISIQDSDGTNTGNAVSVDGSAAATLKLPATIKASLTGNASTATILQTARNIWGQSFNGSADIKGDLFLLSTASGTNINTSSAKLKFNSLYDDDTTIYRSPYIQALNYGSYGRKRLSVFQSNAQNYTDDFVEVFSIYPTGLVYIPSTGSFKIGDCTVTWDSTNNMLKFDKGIYSTGAVSALGSNSSGGGGGSGDFDEDQMWTALQANSGTYANTKINWNHIPVATTSAIGGIKVGTTLAISSGTLNLKASGVTAGTYTKVTVDTYGRVTAGTTLAAGDIPNLSFSKITSDADDLKAIEALTGTSGFLKKTAANTWALDTNGYYALYGGTSINSYGTSSAHYNLDSLITSGSYYCSASATSAYFDHRPTTTNKAFRLWVSASLGTGTTYVRQRFQCYDQLQAWERYSTNGGSTWSNGADNYGWYRVQGNIDGEFLKLSGGTLTGSLFIDAGQGVQATGGYGLLVYHPTTWTGISSTQWGVGAADCQGVIRSSNANLIHYKGGTNYTICDGSNTYVSGGKGYINGTEITTISGNAATATKATQDSNGNTIASTYLTAIGRSGDYLTQTKGGTTSNVTKILERYYTYYNSLNGVGWYRVGRFLSTGAGGSSCIMTISRSFAYRSNEAYVFAITLAYQGGISISQLAGKANSQLIDKIRVEYLNNNNAFYPPIDIHIAADTDGANTYRVVFIGGAETLSTFEKDPTLTGSTFEYSVGIGMGTATRSTDTTKINVTNSNGSIGLSTATNRGVVDNTTGNWLLGTNSTGTNTFLMQGNVGINTTSPSCKLYIENTAQQWALCAHSLYNSVHTSLYAAYGGGQGMWCGSSSTSSSIYIAQFRKGITSAGSGGTSVFYIRADGKIGIGTESPSYALSVSGDVSATNFRGALVGNASTATTLATARTIWGQSFNGSANISGNMTSVGNITPSANGNNLGTTSARFNIYGTAGNFSSNVTVSGTLSVTGAATFGSTITASGNIAVTRSTTTASSVSATNSNGSITLHTSTNRGVYDSTKSVWLIATNGTNTWMSAGNVGIGNTAPSQKLHVTGNILASGDVTASSDERLKTIVGDGNLDLRYIANAPNILFKWNNGQDDKVHGGSLAQYFLTGAKHFVLGSDKDFYSLNYGALATSMAISIAKEVVKHEDRITLLEKENTRLKARIAELEERRIA